MREIKLAFSNSITGSLPFQQPHVKYKGWGSYRCSQTKLYHLRLFLLGWCPEHVCVYWKIFQSSLKGQEYTACTSHPRCLLVTGLYFDSVFLYLIQVVVYYLGFKEKRFKRNKPQGFGTRKEHHKVRCWNQREYLAWIKRSHSTCTLIDWDAHLCSGHNRGTPFSLLLSKLSSTLNE